MKIYRIPEKISALIFDLDSTLYTNDDYVRFQLESPVRRLAEIRGMSPGELQGEIEEYRKDYAKDHEGAQVSLGNIFKRLFNIGMEETIRWREELYKPEDFLSPDPRLRETLLRLRNEYALAVYTNNPVLVARKTLAVLGVEDLFQVITGLDTCRVSKPNEISLRKTAALLGFPPEACVAVGDRYDIDLALPLKLGMGGILVDGVEDIYCLPDELFPKCQILKTSSDTPFLTGKDHLE
ncbi:MAG: HAD family hydrolase [Treponema sp.]|nr:HAD family hydrolase [Treponema sp.]